MYGTLLIVQNELKSMELFRFFHILFFSSFAIVVFVLPKYQNKATVMYILSTLDSLSFYAIRITTGMSPYIGIVLLYEHDFQWSNFIILYKQLYSRWGVKFIVLHRRGIRRFKNDLKNVSLMKITIQIAQDIAVMSWAITFFWRIKAL